VTPRPERHGRRWRAVPRAPCRAAIAAALAAYLAFAAGASAAPASAAAPGPAALAAPELPASSPPAPAPQGALILEADDALRPAYVALHVAFRSAVVAELNGPMTIYNESFDLARFDRPGYAAELFDWHCRKYRGRDVRVVVPIGDPAYEYAIRWRDACAPATPIVFANVSPQGLARIGRASNSTGMTQSVELAEVIRVAFDLLPDTRSVAVVGAPSDRDVYVRDFLASARATFAGRAEILDLTGLPMPTLLERVSSLPPYTIVAFTSLITDGAGRSFAGTDAARIVAQAANAPMFGLATTQLGYGTVGGRLLSPTRIGRDAAGLAVRVFQGEPADSIPVRDADITEYAFDAAAMERWGLGLERLPPGSVVINRRPTLWEAYRSTVVAALAALVVQALLIAALLRERRRRRRVNVQLRRLSGELITSQEKERRRVARELHDDVGQQLALLAIELDQLRARSAGSAVEDGLVEAAARTSAISSGVHDLARDLHPARLETLGLPRALRSFAEEAAKRHGVDVDVTLADWPGDVAADQALTFYRIAQEAVQNAVKHGGAESVSIRLAGGDRELTMTVYDDGRGFPAEAAADAGGIGLVSMRERASLAGGSVAVESERGAGTTVRVVLPVAAAPSDLPPREAAAGA
jgi:signal transduction histidine kinase